MRGARGRERESKATASAPAPPRPAAVTTRGPTTGTVIPRARTTRPAADAQMRDTGPRATARPSTTPKAVMPKSQAREPAPDRSKAKGKPARLRPRGTTRKRKVTRQSPPAATLLHGCERKVVDISTTCQGKTMVRRVPISRRAKPAARPMRVLVARVAPKLPADGRERPFQGR